MIVGTAKTSPYRKRNIIGKSAIRKQSLVEKGAFTPVGKGLLSRFSNRD